MKKLMKIDPDDFSLFFEYVVNSASNYGSGLEKTLFHYTNAEGLNGIINNGEIWGSHYKFTNDPTEIDYSYKLILKILKNFIKKETDSKIKKHFQYYFNLQEAALAIESPLNIYLACFSETKDLLSQWRGYGDNACGYCIGIDLYKNANINPDLYTAETRYSHLFLKKIIYQKRKQEEIIIGVFKHLRAFIEVHKDYDVKGVSGIFLTFFPLIACLMKNPKFKEEKEWRLIYTSNRFVNEGELTIDRQINYRTNNKVIIPYIKMKIKNENSKLIPVNEIIFGPRSNETKARIGIEMLLRNKGYGNDTIPKLKKSSIPLT